MGEELRVHSMQRSNSRIDEQQMNVHSVEHHQRCMPYRRRMIHTDDIVIVTLNAVCALRTHSVMILSDQNHLQISLHSRCAEEIIDVVLLLCSLLLNNKPTSEDSDSISKRRPLLEKVDESKYC